MIGCILRSAVILCLLAAAAGNAAAVPAPGDHLKPFALTNADRKLVEWRPGRVCVLSFCAFWCDTWKEQSKRLSRCRNSLGSQPIDFFTISIDGRWAEGREDKIVGTLLLDLKSALTKHLGINRIPYTLVVDAGGLVRYAGQGIIREAAVTDAVRECAAGTPGTDGETIYLAFDDFPYAQKSESNLPLADPDERLLNILRDNGVPATFFCIGNRLVESRTIVERAAGEGHSLQVHSWDHSAGDPRINQCVQAIKALTGADPVFYRPPGSEKCLQINGLKPLLMPVINPYDYTRPGKDEIKRRIFLAAKPGCVVLLHAGVSETIDALPDIIKSLRQRGFSFDIIPK